MKATSSSYAQFVSWVQADLNRDRVVVNRKVFSVVLWCLILPAALSMLIYFARKIQLIEGFRNWDSVIFLPPFAFALYSLWPTFREIPRVFKKGGLGAMLEESTKEIEWRESVITRLHQDVRLTQAEWQSIAFHLESEIERMNDQNRYMTILSAVVLFLMFQFLDLGSSDIIAEAGPAGTIRMWVDQFSQWGVQIFSLALFSTLFYLSGLQFQRYLKRYWVCVDLITKRKMGA